MNHGALIGIILGSILSISATAQNMEEEIVKYQVKAPTRVKKNEVFTINTLFTIEPNWYIYAPDGLNAAQGKIETKVVFNTKEFIKEGKMKLSDPTIKDNHRVYEGDSIVMVQAFNAAVKSGRYEIRGKVIYQTCNSEICLPPVTEEIIVIINVQ